MIKLKNERDQEQAHRVPTNRLFLIRLIRIDPW